MLIKFQNLYTPINRSNFRNFNEDDRKRQKFNNKKYQLVFLITVMLIKYLHQGYTKQFDIRNVNVKKGFKCLKKNHLPVHVIVYDLYIICILYEISAVYS